MYTCFLFPKNKFILFLFLLFVVLFLGCSRLDRSNTPSDFYELAFLNHHDNDLDIYIANTGSSKTLQLTDSQRDDIHAVWSTDGNRIAYSSTEHGVNEIYVVDATGKNLRRLTSNKIMDVLPQWSPDGKNLAYIASGSNGESIVLFDFEKNTSTTLFKLTREKGSSLTGIQFSPDGKFISYIEVEGKNLALKMMSISNPVEQSLVDDVAVSDYQWSPDGKKVAFTARKNRQTNIYVYDFADRSYSQITKNRHLDNSPHWLPSGKSLVFLSSRDEGGRAQLYRLDIDTNKITRLSNSGLEEMDIDVSKDGTKVAKVRFENRFFHTYVFDLNSGEAIKIAENLQRAHLQPKFRP